jgi:enamine deaminase RidA (YjgF/YER057c/UK114 family)
MPKMIQGKNAEKEKQRVLQNVENIFGQIGQTIENVVNST